MIWCDDGPASELGRAFNKAALMLAESAFSFSWINRQAWTSILYGIIAPVIPHSTEHSSLLDDAFGLAGDSFPTVLTLQLHKVSPVAILSNCQSVTLLVKAWTEFVSLTLCAKLLVMVRN